MNYDTLNSLAKQGLSSYKIASQLNCSQTNVRYWLDKHGISSQRKKKDFEKDQKKCPRCHQEKPLQEFYLRRDKTDSSPYCKICTGEQTLERQREFKRNCVEYKGDSCQVCGYNKCFGALEFHHVDKSKKDFSISQARLTSFSSKIKTELDKCILVCSNCHREIHAGLIDLTKTYSR